MIGKGTKALLAGCFFWAACSPTKHIPEGDALYTGATVNLSADNVTVRQKKVLHADLEGLTRPRPNSRFLGIPFKLMLWNFFYTTKEKGLRANLQRKLGQPPVLASSVDLDANVSTPPLRPTPPGSGKEPAPPTQPKRARSTRSGTCYS